MRCRYLCNSAASSGVRIQVRPRKSPASAAAAPRVSFARHRMAAQKLRPCDALPRQVDDFAFRAARVRHQSARLHQRFQVANRIQYSPNRLREEDEVRLAGRQASSVALAAIDRAGGERVRNGTRGTDAGDRAREACFAQRESERGADQTCSDDDDVLHVRSLVKGTGLRPVLNGPAYRGRGRQL